MDIAETHAADLLSDILSWSASDFHTFFRACEAPKSRSGYSIHTIEAIDPPESEDLKDKPRVGRIYCVLRRDGVFVTFKHTPMKPDTGGAKAARTALRTAILCGLTGHAWVTAYDDEPQEGDLSVVFRSATHRPRNQPLSRTPAYAGRIWTAGDLGDHDPYSDIYDWSMNDVGSVSLLTNEPSLRDRKKRPFTHCI